MSEVRLIDANAAADKIMRETEVHADEIGVGGVALMIGFARALRDETSFPTIEADSVRHGRWIFGGVYGTYHCSLCDKIETERSTYCRACGAKMDGGAENG